MVIEIPELVEETSDDESETDQRTESREVGPPIGDNGRTSHQEDTDTKMGTKPAIVNMDRSSQTTNTYSTITGPSQLYPQQYGYTQGLIRANYANQPYQLQLHDTGNSVSIQQLNLILATVEKQTYSVMSSHISQILAFHDPVNGIKNMFIDEFNKFHETVRTERTTRNREQFKEHFPSEPTNIPRRKSLGDLTENQKLDSQEMLSTQQTESTTIESQSADSVTMKNTTATKKVSGSYSSNFIPHPEPALQATQDTNEGNKTPVNKVMNPTPSSYRGEIRDIGDGVMRTLDNQLKSVEGGEKEPNESTDNAETNLCGDSTMSDENANVEADAPKKRDDAMTAPQASETPPISERTRTRKQQQTQTHIEKTTGEPPPTKVSSKPAKKGQ
eukprot:scaffold248431_cov105-Cyclotella_meneghiniana.AAC.1